MEVDSNGFPMAYDRKGKYLMRDEDGSFIKTYYNSTGKVIESSNGNIVKYNINGEKRKLKETEI